jgi:sialic acid synthase SpsE
MADTYGEHRELMEFNEEQFLELQTYSIKQGLFFTASGWDFPSVDFLAHINVPFLKVASADLTNLPLLTHIARKQVPVFLSTGMADMNQVRLAFDTISSINPNIALLQCTSSYPAPLDQVHLNVLHQYREQFPETVLGYSGHELGIEVCLAAVAMGANIIEKHLTLNKMAKGTDHSAALDPKELEQLVKNIRIVEQAMGSFTKTIQPSEKECIAKLTKSLTSTQTILKGQCIHESMLTTKSPGSGISPLHISTLVGLVANQDIPMDTTLTWNMFV